MICALKVKKGKPVHEKADALLLPLFENVKEPGGPAKDVDEATGGLIHQVLESGDFTGSKHQTALLYTNGTIPAKRILLVGLGKEEDCTVDIVRGAGGKAFSYARDLGIKNVVVSGTMLPLKKVTGDVVLEAFPDRWFARYLSV